MKKISESHANILDKDLGTALNKVVVWKDLLELFILKDRVIISPFSLIISGIELSWLQSRDDN